MAKFVIGDEVNRLNKTDIFSWQKIIVQSRQAERNPHQASVISGGKRYLAGTNLSISRKRLHSKTLLFNLIFSHPVL